MEALWTNVSETRPSSDIAWSDEGLVSEMFVHKASISVLFYQT
jgi:hypothetical protein